MYALQCNPRLHLHNGFFATHDCFITHLFQFSIFMLSLMAVTLCVCKIDHKMAHYRYPQVPDNLNCMSVHHKKFAPHNVFNMFINEDKERSRKGIDEDEEEEEEEEDDEDDLFIKKMDYEDLGAFANGQTRSQYVRVWGSWDTVRTILSQQLINLLCIKSVSQQQPLT